MVDIARTLALKALRAYWWIRRPVTLGVKGVLLDEEGRVLLVRHTYQPGWHLPGGGVKSGESLIDAVIREVREETGHLVEERPDDAFGIYCNFTEFKSDHVAVFVFRRWQQLKPHRRSPEIDEFGFFSLAALPAETTPATRRRLDEVTGSCSRAREW